jgi:hypothetical protein
VVQSTSTLSLEARAHQVTTDRPKASPATFSSQPNHAVRLSNHSAATNRSATMQFAFRSASNDGHSARSSICSESSAPTVRSSFALERPDMSLSQPSLEVFGPVVKGPKDTKAAAATVQTVRALSDPVRQCARVFSVLSSQSLIPLQV